MGNDKPASAPPADALLPCPFCGNPNVTNDEGCFPMKRDHSAWEVRCGNPSCYAHEQQAATREEAIAKWNRRAASAQVREVEPWGYEFDDAAGAHHVVQGPLPSYAQRNIKPAAEPAPCTAADDTPSKSRAKRIRLEKGESVAVAQGEKDWKSIAENTAAECERMRADHVRIVAALQADTDAKAAIAARSQS